jgi:hypothetical protein
MIPFRAFLFCWCLLALASAFNSAQDPSSTQGSSSSSTQSTDDAAAKAAERKKHFEEMKKELEEKNPEPPPAPASAKPVANPGPRKSLEEEYPHDPVVSTIMLNMSVGDTQSFQLFTDKNENVTAQAEWTVDDPSIAELSVYRGTPTYLGKKVGTVIVEAHTKSVFARAMVHVMDRKQMELGIVRWDNNAIPVKAPLYMVPAIPNWKAR